MALLASRSTACTLWSRLLPRSTSFAFFHKTQERNAAVRSSMFPEYSMIYDFDKIRSASRVGKVKLQVTILSAAGTSAIFLAKTLGYISPEFLGTFAFIGCGITVFFHSIGFLFNNVIGYIYVKDDGETVKISHVGYWGNRVDVDTTIDQISAFTDTPTGFLSNPWYQRVRLLNSKKTFKMYLKPGAVLEPKLFTGIFGKVYS